MNKPLTPQMADESRHSPAFQVAVAMAAVEARLSEAEIAQRYGVSIEQVRQWKNMLLEDAVSIFRERHRPPYSGEEISQNELALTIAENSTQGFAMMDERGYCIYANRAWLQMTGYSSAEIASKPLHDLVHHHHPDGRPYPKDDCPIDRSLPENFLLRAHEDIFFRKDGTTFPVMCAASPIFKNGQPVATVIEIRDISRQKQIDEELQRASRRQEFLLQIAETLRSLEQPADVMAAASQLIGEYFKSSRVGYGEIDLAEATVTVHGDWTDGVMASLAGESRPLDSFGPGIINELKNGISLRLDDIAADPRSAPYAAGYASIGVQSMIAVPLLEESRFTAILYLHEPSPRQWTEEEITLAEDLARRTWEAVKRARAEEKLREETRILELLNETGKIVSSTLDMQTLLQSITDSATQLSGAQFGALFYATEDEHSDTYTLYTWSGVPKEAFEKFGQPHVTPLFDPTFKGEIVRSDDVLSDPRYGKRAPYHGMPENHLPVRSYMAIPVISRSGQVIGGLLFGHSKTGVFNERSERILIAVAAQAAVAIDNARLYKEAQKAAEERQVLLSRERSARAEAERLSQMKDEFLAMLAHELRNPLAPIGSAAELLSLAYADDSRIRQSSGIISRQVKHMRRLVDDLLDVSRVTRGLVVLDKSILDFRHIVSSALDQSGALIEQKHHQLTASLPDAPVWVYGDEIRLVQAVTNLVNNAAKYTPEAGRIEISVEASSEKLRLSIKDNGTGISPELLPDIFELFTQGTRTLARSQGGLGLGLTLVKKLVELYDGAVAAFSAGIDQGSEFIVTLPLAVLTENTQPDGASLPPDQMPSHVEQDAGKLRLMVIDDNADAADVLSSLLRAQGHTVSVYYTANDALDKAAADMPHAFLVDIGLPDMDGYKLVGRLRAVPQAAHSTFIAVSGYGQVQDKERSKAAGFDHHLVKPVDMVALNALLQQIHA